MAGSDASAPRLREAVGLVGSPSTFRALATASGLGLVLAYLSVFFYIVDVAGGRGRFVLVVALTAGVSLLVARFVSARIAAGLGVGLLVAGLATYLATVPRVYARAFSLRFVRNLLTYLTGVSVLRFLRVDVWAIALVPAPLFLSLYFLARRRYGASALVGGLVLGFFASTGDADPTVTLAGALALLGTLAFGTLDRAGGSWDQIERLGLVAIGGVVAARLLPTSRAGSAGAGALDRPSLEATLLHTGGEVDVLGSISLSPKVQFVVESDVGAYWHAAAYDRYTGGSWIRTGETTEYEGTLLGPPGRGKTVVQSFDIRRPIQVLASAWKPIRVTGTIATALEVTALGDVLPTRTLDAEETYTVVSEMPPRDPDRLREAGTDYPVGIDNYLQLPESTPDRVARKAAAVAGDAETPYDAAVAIEEWLPSTKDYSLDVTRPGGDVVDGFLFGMDAGYCVYFASAMTVMLRTLDVPARFVTGYATGEPVEEGRWVVRGLDSHAWVEVYFPEVGWVRFDPTPSRSRAVVRQRRIQRARRRGVGGVDAAGTNPLASPTADTPTPTPTPDATGTPTPGTVGPTNSSSLDDGASSPVTGTPDTRVPRVTRALVSRTLDIESSTETPAAAPDSGVLSERDRITAIASAAGLMLGAHRLGLFERLGRAAWLRYQSPSESPRADVERAFARLEHHLARDHRERDPSETPRQYVDAIAETDDIDPRVRDVALQYERAQYGGTISREAADDAIDAVDDIVREW